jgi:hypothetical protein
VAFQIEKDEATAGRRFVPFRLFNSDGTSPDTNASNGTMLASLNGAAQISIGSISVVSANAGMYGMQLTASNVSTLGSLALYTDTLATDFPQHVATVQIVNYNPMSIQSGVIIAGGSYSSTTVRLDLVAYSGATVGAGNFAPGVYSGVSFSVRDSGIATSSFQAGNYSGVSVEVKTKGIATNSIETVNIYSSLTIQGINNYANISNVTLAAGTHSNVTIQGVTRINSSVTIADANYSAVTVRPDLQSYSGLTLGINNIAPNAYSGVTVDGAKFLSTAGERSAASSLLSTSLGGTTPRLYQQAIELLRNKVTISGSTMTVFKADDTTSSWTATISTGTATVYGVTPGIA